ncbi:DUF2786 domain-containing protein [Bowmanella denitrificans]|uniref:DUF2786 domain-containing protein n=1 Tax=Bowmanella denitrificans TaxID=366582 RepID=UPI000C9B250D|nr:DUF2786 domain-containing protein [Bowmanella denitrificans]
MSSDKIIDKIKKLLALAKSSNPHEAAAALSRAQKLMQQHSIDQQSVALSDCDRVSHLLDSGRVNSYEAALVDTINRAFGVEAVFSKSFLRQEYYVYFLGIKPQPELARYCFSVLYRQLKDARSEYVANQPKQCKRTTKTQRGDAFAWGWVGEVKARVQAFALTEEQQVLIQEYKGMKYPSLQSKDPHDSLSKKGVKLRDDDFYQGRKAAKNVRLDRPVGGRETAKLTR